MFSIKLHFRYYHPNILNTGYPHHRMIVLTWILHPNIQKLCPVLWLKNLIGPRTHYVLVVTNMPASTIIVKFPRLAIRWISIGKIYMVRIITSLDMVWEKLEIWSQGEEKTSILFWSRCGVAIKSKELWDYIWKPHWALWRYVLEATESHLANAAGSHDDGTASLTWSHSTTCDLSSAML